MKYLKTIVLCLLISSVSLTVFSQTASDSPAVYQKFNSAYSQIESQLEKGELTTALEGCNRLWKQFGMDQSLIPQLILLETKVLSAVAKQNRTNSSAEKQSIASSFDKLGGSETKVLSKSSRESLDFKTLTRDFNRKYKEIECLLRRKRISEAEDKFSSFKKAFRKMEEFSYKLRFLESEMGQVVDLDKRGKAEEYLVSQLKAVKRFIYDKNYLKAKENLRKLGLFYPDNKDIKELLNLVERRIQESEQKAQVEKERKKVSSQQTREKEVEKQKELFLSRQLSYIRKLIFQRKYLEAKEKLLDLRKVYPGNRKIDTYIKMVDKNIVDEEKKKEKQRQVSLLSKYKISSLRIKALLRQRRVLKAKEEYELLKNRFGSNPLFSEQINSLEKYMLDEMDKIIAYQEKKQKEENLRNDISKARRLIEDGDLSSARESLIGLLKKYPGKGEITVLLDLVDSRIDKREGKKKAEEEESAFNNYESRALSAIYAGELDSARQILSEAKNAVNSRFQGQLKSLQKRIDKAEENIRKKKEKSEMIHQKKMGIRFDFLYSDIKSLIRKKDLSGAEDEYRRMVKEFGGEDRFSAKLDKVSRDITKALKEKERIEKEVKFREDIKKAKDFIQIGKYKEADTFLAELNKNYPYNSEISRLMYKIKLLKERWRDTEFKRLSLETANLIKQKDLSGAKDKYKQMVKEFGEDRFSMGMSSLQKRLSLALNKEKAKRERTLFRQKVAEAKRSISGKDYLRAKNILNKLVKEYPGNKRAMSLLNYTENKLSAVVSMREKKAGILLNKWERILDRQKKTERKKITRHPVGTKILSEGKKPNPVVPREQFREQSINGMLNYVEQDISFENKMKEIESDKDKEALQRDKELKDVEEKVYELKKAKDYISIGRYKQAAVILKRLKVIYPEDKKINGLLFEIKGKY